MRDFDAYFLRIASTVADMGTCPRAKVGAVLVSGRRIVSTGYNGAPTGTTHCEDIGCCMEHGHCTRAVHAEVNAILQATLLGIPTKGLILYCTHRPCLNCTKAIINSGIKKIFFLKEYDAGLLAKELLLEAGVEIRMSILQTEAGGCEPSFPRTRLSFSSDESSEPGEILSSPNIEAHESRRAFFDSECK